MKSYMHTFVDTCVFGNMYAQTWANLYKDTAPYPDEETIDITDELKRQNYTVKRIFEDAEQFFVSLGLKKLPQSFWDKTQFVKPPDRDVVCHASAWDFADGDDVRVKMCTKITMEDYTTVHHELGHIQYYLQYKHLPGVFRSGANPGFHEALGDTMSLSVQTPKHLRQLGLLSQDTDPQKDERQQVNYLYLMGLEKLPFLPFGYIVDLWRWRIFAGLDEAEWNKEWNRLRTQYQGIHPPVSRDDPDFMDAVGKYHVANNVPYIRYFVSFVLQFQFYERLCDIAGHQGPLSSCDFYNSKEAGKALERMLKQGKSRPWQDILKEMVATDQLDASAVLRYFEPLSKWLDEQTSNECYGWGADHLWPKERLEQLPKPRC